MLVVGNQHDRIAQRDPEERYEPDHGTERQVAAGQENRCDAADESEGKVDQHQQHGAVALEGHEEKQHDAG